MISIGSGWHSISNFGMNIKNHNCLFLFFFLKIFFLMFVLVLLRYMQFEMNM